MIRSFRNVVAEAAWERRAVKGASVELLRTAYRKLLQLDNAKTLNDMRSPPGNRLEPLRGKRHGQYSVRINDQWRVRFRWDNGEAHDVEVCDYHDE